MNTILAAGLVVLAMQPDHRTGTEPATPPMVDTGHGLAIAGRLLKNTPDAVLDATLADPGIPLELSRGIRDEQALRNEWRSKGFLEHEYR